MRELNSTEHAAVSGGLTTSDVRDWISNLLRPRPTEPWETRFPADYTNTAPLATLGKVIFAAAVTGIVAAATLIGTGSKLFARQ
ncbi:conserved protein of unknown function [Burkholderia multivorans]